MILTFEIGLIREEFSILSIKCLVSTKKYGDKQTSQDPTQASNTCHGP